MNEIKFYRRKSIIIKAFKLGSEVSKMPDWIKNNFHSGNIIENEDHEGKKEYEIKTLEGHLTARAGDYVVEGLKAEIYPVRADIFKLSYERV